MRRGLPKLTKPEHPPVHATMTITRGSHSQLAPRLPYGFYAIAYSPADKRIWGSNLTHPGYIIRLDPGRDPPDTALPEIY